MDLNRGEATGILPSLNVKTARSWRGILPFTHLAREGRMTVTIGRRELLAALGGAAAAWPLAARAVAERTDVGNRSLASGLSANPENRYHPRSSGLAGLYGTGTNNREVSRESSLHQFGRWRCALRRHVGTGIRDAYEQCRRCSERPRAKPKRALRVQSVPVPMATELLPWLPLRLWVVLRLWTKLLRLWTRRRLWTKLPALPLKAASRRKLKPLQPPGRYLLEAA
jgi:hypothetical protein